MKTRAHSLAGGAVATKRGAIYIRNTTTVGLGEEFDPLDAQRAACVADIAWLPGWRVIDHVGDDSGFTGDEVKHPMFERLLADIDAGRVAVVFASPSTGKKRPRRGPLPQPREERPRRRRRGER